MKKKKKKTWSEGIEIEEERNGEETLLCTFTFNKKVISGRGFIYFLASRGKKPELWREIGFTRLDFKHPLLLFVSH